MQVIKLASTLALKLRASVTEIRNWGISGLIKGLMSSKNVLKKRRKILAIIEWALLVDTML